MEDLFAGLKMKMDFLDQFRQAFGDDDDPAIQKQILVIKKDVRSDIFKLVRTGASLPDIFARFGALLFKSQVLQARDFLKKNGDQELVDLVSEDQLLQDRIAAMNDPLGKNIELMNRKKRLGGLYVAGYPPAEFGVPSNISESGSSSSIPASGHSPAPGGSPNSPIPSAHHSAHLS